MKKTLLLMLTLMMSICAWAQDPDWSVTEFSGSISNNSTTINEATWTLSGTEIGSNTNGTPTWTISSKKWKFGNSKSQFWSSYTLSTEAFNSYNITKVEIGCYDNGGTESTITAKQGDITIGSESVSTTTATNVETLNATSGEGGKLSITFTSTKQASYITSIKIYYSLGSDAVHVTSVSLDKKNLTVMATRKATLVATVLPANATNKNVSWSSSDDEIATVENGVVKGLKEGTATITVTTADGNLTDECSVTVTPKTAPAGAVFYESFDQMNGKGGNDGVWSGITTSEQFGTCDNNGWATEGTVMSGYQCASIRKCDATTPSGLTTPAIGIAGDGNITFNAQSWGTDTSDFYVDIVGGGTFTAATGVSLTNNGTTAKVTLTKKSEWVDYDLSFTGLTDESKFRFHMAANKRGFLDEVAVFVSSKEPTYTEKSVTFAASSPNEYYNEYYATFSSDKDAFITEMDESYGYMAAVYTVSVNDGELVIAPLGDENYDTIEVDGAMYTGYYVPANTGILLTAAFETENTTIPYFDVENVEISAITDNMLCPASKTMEGDFKFYKLAYNDYTAKTGLGFYYGATDGAAFTCKAGTAYLAVPAAQASAKGYAFNGTTTAISNVATQNTANSVAYNLAGQRVNANQKGIVIVNGMKRINK